MSRSAARWRILYHSPRLSTTMRFATLLVLLALATPIHAQTVITVTAASDDLIANGNCTLREAVQAANTNSAVDACPAGGTGVDQIVLSAGQTYALSLAGASEDANQTGDLDVSTNLAIQGSGATIDAQQIDRVFDVIGGTVTLGVLTLTQGAAPDGSAGSPAEGGGALRVSGGSVFVEETAFDSNAAGQGIEQSVRCRRRRGRLARVGRAHPVPSAAHRQPDARRAARSGWHAAVRTGLPARKQRRGRWRHRRDRRDAYGHKRHAERQRDRQRRARRTGTGLQLCRMSGLWRFGWRRRTGRRRSGHRRARLGQRDAALRHRRRKCGRQRR